MSFQNLMATTSSDLESLHDLVMVWLTLILAVVILVGLMVFFSSSKTSLAADSTVLEQILTVFPIIILISIAWPSIHLLCSQDSFKFYPSFNLKIISNQWNWSSESLEDENDHLLDMEELDPLSSLEIPLTTPSKLTRLVISSSDVLHSLGLPSLGVKLDSVPGRLNCTSMLPLQGLHVGSCYELCGSGHSAMPVSLLAVKL